MTLNARSLITGNISCWIIRGLQFAFSVISLALIICKGGLGATSFYFFLLSIICTLYLIILAIVSFSSPKSIIPGSIIIIDPIFTALWFIAFVLVAFQLSQITCTEYYHVSNRVYKYYDQSCDTVRIAVIFGALEFLSFFVTSIFVGLNVIKPLKVLIEDKSKIWIPIKYSNLELNRHFLSLKTTEASSKQTDIETGVTNEKPLMEQEQTNTGENVFADIQDTNTASNDAPIITITDEEPAVNRVNA